MAYVYGNSTNASVALIAFGLVQLAMFVSCFFGCEATDYMSTYASQAWSGAIAVLTGLFGVCMVQCYKETKWGTTYCIFAIAVIVTSLANMALILVQPLLDEIDLVLKLRDQDEAYWLTGIAIYGVGVLAGFAVLVAAIVISCLNCCCERSPGKGYTVASTEYVEHRDDDYNSNYNYTAVNTTV